MKSRRHNTTNGTSKLGSLTAPLFCVVLYPSAAYIVSVEPETPPAVPLSVSAAQTPQPSAGKPKTKGAFGKPKAMKRMSDYFPAPYRLKRQATFAANAMPKEPDQMSEHIAKEQGWEKK